MVRSKSALAVCDAGPLIHLDELGCLDALSGFSQLLIPEMVWQEVLRHRPEIVLPSTISFQRQSSANRISEKLVALSQVFSLHHGELEALQLCLLTGECLFLTDDTAARLTAYQLGLSAHGTIGLLIRAIRISQRSREQVLELLNRLPVHSTLHLKRDLLEEVIASVQQSS